MLIKGRLKPINEIKVHLLLMQEITCNVPQFCYFDKCSFSHCLILILDNNRKHNFMNLISTMLHFLCKNWDKFASKNKIIKVLNWHDNICSRCSRSITLTISSSSITTSCRVTHYTLMAYYLTHQSYTLSAGCPPAYVSQLQISTDQCGANHAINNIL